VKLLFLFILYIAALYLFIQVSSKGVGWHGTCCL